MQPAGPLSAEAIRRLIALLGKAATVTLDGPGQGETAFHLPIRTDWGRVLGAVIDVLEQRDDVDGTRVGVVGQSLGAFYAPLAAAGEPRLKACVANCGPFDFAPVLPQMPLVSQQVFSARAHARTQAEADASVARLTLEGKAQHIRCPLLIVFGGGDRLIPPSEGERLAKAVMAELGPLKLDRARFRVALEPIAEGRRGPLGVETIRFEVATNAGTEFGPLDSVASGGELARFALAMKAALAGREDQRQPVMIFDEVDQGVGGAVAEAVGQRLKRLATGAQVLVVTHSPQVAARGHAHWKVRKADRDGMTTTTVDTLDDHHRREEIARMLSGAEITDAARAAAGALIG
jgi:hypothetical protein